MKKIKTVRIYRNTCIKSVIMDDQGSGFNLEPWGQDTPEIQGYDDDGQDYVLPNGYEADYTLDGQKGIFHGDIYCDIVTHSSGWPQLISDDPHKPVLKLA